MAAIVRVKRRRNEDPADSIIFSCKRTKLDKANTAASGDKSDCFKSQFKFAGTVTRKEDHVTKHVREAIRKDKLEKDYKLHAVGDVVAKQRVKHECSVQANRYKIVSNKRASDLDSLNCDTTDTASATSKLDSESEENAASSKVFCLYDVVSDGSSNSRSSIGGGNPKSGKEERRSEITCNGVPLVREKAPTDSKDDEENYVYDIYYMNSGKFDFHELENDLTVEAMFQDQLVYDEYRASECAEVYDDDDDSNDEDNWRNDYPDEDPRFFENEDIEYQYGDDGCNFEDFGTEQGIWKVNSMMHRGLRLSSEESGDEEQASDAEDDQACLSLPQLPTDLWAPQTSYEKYKARVSKELESSEDTGEKKNLTEGTPVHTVTTQY